MDIKKVLEESSEKIKNLKLKTLESVESIRLEYFGKKGILIGIASSMKDLDIEEKKEVGSSLNKLKEELEQILDEAREELEHEKLEAELEKEKIDITLDATTINVGAPHILEKLIEELESVFISLGFDVVEGPEVETDLYNFEMLNLPVGHPARDAQDTFYIEDDKWLLRSQTSPVQVRTMLKNENKDYVRIICPGKTYRRDNDDATHSHQFTQMEGLLVGKNVSLAHLKGTLDMMASKMFGTTNTRFRPSFYPFTEPSVEYDVECFNCKGEGCNICKNTGFITIGGAGVVHPNVLKGCGYDTEVYTGFAFGMGLERIAMLKYGIKDIRTFYLNDLRTTKEFVKREGE